MFPREYLRRGAATVLQAAGDAGFQEYYHLGRTDESLPARREPQEKRELRTVYEPSHSPFGIIWQIASATGWSVHYILWKVNYQTLSLMLADAPRYVTAAEPKKQNHGRIFPIKIEIEMKPVKIEYLTKDVTRAGLSGVSGGLDGVGKDAEAAMRKIRKARSRHREDEGGRIESAVARCRGGRSVAEQSDKPARGLSDIEPGTELRRKP